MKLTWCVLGFSTLLEAFIISPSTSLLIIPKKIMGILPNLTLWTYCQSSCPTVQLANYQHDYEVKGKFLKLIFIGVELTYDVVLVFFFFLYSKVNQLYIYSFFTFFSHVGLEKEMTTHSSILAWRIPWTEEPGRLQSMGLQTNMYIYIYIYIYCFLPSVSGTELSTLMIS